MTANFDENRRPVPRVLTMLNGTNEAMPNVGGEKGRNENTYKVQGIVHDHGMSTKLESKKWW